MQKGQFSEVLNNLGDIFENSLSKGFKTNLNEVGKTLVTLYNASGNSTLWQGELGAKRLEQLGAGIEKSTALNSTNDVIIHKAIASMSKEDRTGLLTKYNIASSGDDFIDMQMIKELGFTPEVFQKTMALQQSLQGNDSRERIAFIAKTFTGGNYIEASNLDKMRGKIDPAKSHEIKSTDLKTEGSSVMNNVSIVEATKDFAIMKGMDTDTLLSGSIGGPAKLPFTIYMEGKLPSNNYVEALQHDVPAEKIVAMRSMPEIREVGMEYEKIAPYLLLKESLQKYAKENKNFWGDVADKLAGGIDWFLSDAISKLKGLIEKANGALQGSEISVVANITGDIPAPNDSPPQ